MNYGQEMAKVNVLTSQVLDAAFEVHKNLGPGLLESTYQECLMFELKQKNLEIKKEVYIGLKYKELNIENAYRIDLLVDGSLVVQKEAVEHIIEKHIAQTLTYLRFGGFKLGLLLNFIEQLLKNGIKRVIL